MALPLPSVIPDVGPGGGLVTAMRGINALQNDILANKIKGIEAEYAPLTTRANALSKLAYANLMGPQFVAKLLQNKDVQANLDNPQKLLGLVTNAATEQNYGNALNMMPQQSQSSPFSNLVKNIKNAFGYGEEEPKNALMMSPQQQAIAQQQMGGQPQQFPMQPQQQAAMQSPDNSGYAYDRNGRNIVATPEEIENAANRRVKWSENVGQSKGIEKEGEILGAKRGEAIDDLDREYKQLLQTEAPINHLIDMTQDPVFQNMRNKVPFFQDKQLWALSKIGTPQEQKAIGDFIASTKNIVASGVQGFKGQAMKKEFDFMDSMKISDNDTWDVMLGKLESLPVYNEMAMNRNREAVKLMQSKHMNLGDAIEAADKKVDGNAIRKSIQDRINPKPTDEDIKYMAGKHGISEEEVRKRLKAKGLL